MDLGTGRAATGTSRAARAAAVASLAALLAACGAAGTSPATRSSASRSSPTTSAAAPAPLASNPGSAAPRAPSPPALRQVAFFDAERGYGLFEQSSGAGDSCRELVGRTTDGGAVFSSLAPVTSGPCGSASGVSGISFSDHGDGFAYGPALYASHDGGGSWAAVPEPGPVLDVVPLGSSVWMVTAACPAGASAAATCELRLSQSGDGGRSWQPSPVQPPVRTYVGSTRLEPAQGQSWLVRTGVDRAYVVGSPALPSTGAPDSAPLAWTDDGGASWSTGRVPCAIPALSVVLSAAPGGALVAVCAGEPSAGFQAKSTSVSTDGGRTWSVRGPCRAGSVCPSSPLTGGYLASVAALSATTVFEIGLRGGLDETTDGGRTWTGRLDPGAVDGTPAQVVFFDAQDGLVLGSADSATAPVTIWHTVDGGASWAAVVPTVGGT